MSEQLPGFMEAIRSRAAGGRAPDREARSLLAYLFTSTRGGLTRLRIVALLLDGPLNANRIARELGLSYKSAAHHMRVLEANNLVSRDGAGYGAAYGMSAFLEAHLGALAEAAGELRVRAGRKKVYL